MQRLVPVPVFERLSVLHIVYGDTATYIVGAVREIGTKCSENRWSDYYGQHGG